MIEVVVEGAKYKGFLKKTAGVLLTDVIQPGDSKKYSKRSPQNPV